MLFIFIVSPRGMPVDNQELQSPSESNKTGTEPLWYQRRVPTPATEPDIMEPNNQIHQMEA